MPPLVPVRLEAEGARALSFADDVGKDGQFKSVTTFWRFDMKWVINMVSELSDLTVPMITEATKHDEQAPRHLLQFALCYQAGLSIGQNGKVKEVLRSLFHKRHIQLGSRLQDFVKDGGLNADKSINRKRGVYTLGFGGDLQTSKLTKITHISGDSVETSGSAVTREWSLTNNWSDYDAMLGMRPLKPTPVSQFFTSSKNGPFKFKKMSGDNKVFQSELEEMKKFHLR